MIDGRIFRLTPKRVFCPLCGDWHVWTGKTLQSYDKKNTYEYECNEMSVELWVDKDYLNIHVINMCEKFFDEEVNARFGLSDIEYDETEPIIKLPLHISSYETICRSECIDCEYCDDCNFVAYGEHPDDDKDEFDLEFKFEFASRFFNKYAEPIRQEKLRKQAEENARLQKEAVSQPKKEECSQEEPTKRNNTVSHPENQRTNQMNLLLMYLLLKKYSGEDEDMMKLMFMYFMLSGSIASNMHPLMTYLMLDMFMGKKKEEKVQQLPQNFNPETA